MFSLLREVDGWKEEGRMTEEEKQKGGEKGDVASCLCCVCRTDLDCSEYV